MALPNLILLNGYELTDQGRTFSSSREEVSTSVQLASGLTKKYFMMIKYSFALEWKMLPSSSLYTYDNKIFSYPNLDNIAAYADINLTTVN